MSAFLRCTFILLPVVILTLAGCTATRDHSATIARQSQRLGAIAKIIPAGQFQLQTLQIMPRKSQTLRVYIEGDGRAWARRSRPSSDPTPRGLLVFDLMSADPFSDKAYIARPCQFVMSDSCGTIIWTDLRYGRQAVTSINAALNQLKAQGKYQSLELIGFSGGAALALLSAAQRKDVASVRTVAGNLDPAFVNQLHNVSAMPLALNPVDSIQQLSSVPQLHFYGENDPVIPSQVFIEYRAKFSTNGCIKGKEVRGASHQKGWLSHWPALLKEPLPKCLPAKT